jgi:hypothetical protein
MNYTLLNSDQPNIPGLRFRSTRKGPESDMVLSFIDNLDIKTPRGCNVTLFQEPKLDSGFPDIVMVIWNQAVTEKWNPMRLHLQSTDIRVLHYLTTIGSSEKTEIERFFGSKVASSLNNLEAADMIRQTRNRYVARPLSKLYAARKIIAVEAKISQWRGALDQAFTNRWFASESAVLLPKISTSTGLLSRAKSLGIEVWSMDDAYCIDRRNCSITPPMSYASWLFNEWVWRALVI